MIEEKDLSPAQRQQIEDEITRRSNFTIKSDSMIRQEVTQQFLEALNFKGARR